MKEELAKSNLVFDNKLTQKDKELNLALDKLRQESKEFNLIVDNKLTQQSKETKDQISKVEEAIKLQQNANAKQDQ